MDHDKLGKLVIPTVNATFEKKIALRTQNADQPRRIHNVEREVEVLKEALASDLSLRHRAKDESPGYAECPDTESIMVNGMLVSAIGRSEGIPAVVDNGTVRAQRQSTAQQTTVTRQDNQTRTNVQISPVTSGIIGYTNTASSFDVGA